MASTSSVHSGNWARNVDKIHVEDLQLPSGVYASDMWGNAKEQPCLVSLIITLSTGFDTAASLDELDDSTIHYGHLCKSIRASWSDAYRQAEKQDIEALFSCIQTSVATLAEKQTRPTIIDELVITVSLPKAGRIAENVQVIRTLKFGAAAVVVARQHEIRYHAMQMAVLIGVNAYERNERQPLIVTFSLHIPSSSTSGGVTEAPDYTSIFKLESCLIDIIEPSKCETLENLAERTYQELYTNTLGTNFSGCSMRLKLAKPRAVVWAHAPAIEIFRTVPGSIR